MLHRDQGFGLTRRQQRRLLRSAGAGFRVFLASALIWQTFYFSWAQAQDIILDPNGNVGFRPSVNRGGAAPVVDIARPNSGGVSVNRYERFSVGQSGVVLNNATNGTTTTLNGAIARNPNLNGRSADTIINEVTSAFGSSLQGTVEVAGQRANVIIANPNGITCDGCSFLNTRDATLTTGRPVVNGSLVTLDVKTGTVRIGRGGLNGAATGVDGVNLIGRAVIVDGKLTAIEQINISGGVQRYNLNARSAMAGTGTGSAPEYVVDGSHFGAMEAGRIQVVGTEAGLGVRSLGEHNATGGSFTIRSQGNLVIGSGRATQDVTVAAAGRVQQDRDLAAPGGKIDLNGLDYVSTDRAGIYGDQSVTLRFDNRIEARGQIQTRGLLALNAAEVSFQGILRTEGTLDVDAAQDFEVIGAAVLSNRIDTNAGGETRFESSFLTALDTFFVVTESFRLGEGNVFSVPSGEVVRIDVAGRFTNATDLRNHDNLDIQFGGDLVNLETGIFAKDDLALVVNGTITNHGLLAGEDTLSLQAEGLFNQETGRILAGQADLDLDGDLRNSGLIQSLGGLNGTVQGAFANDGIVRASALTLTTDTFLNAQTGLLEFNETAEISAAGLLRNAGRLTAVDGLVATAGGALLNEGAIGSNGAVQLAADSLTNTGMVFGDLDVSAQTAGALANAGRIESNGALSLRAGTALSVVGELDAVGAVSLAGQSVSLASPSIVLGGDLMVDAGTVEMAGLVGVAGEAAITAQGGVQQTGQVYAEGAISVFADRLVTGVDSVMIARADLADGDVALNPASTLQITAATAQLAGLAQAGGDLTADVAGAIALLGTAESVAGSVSLTTGDLDVGAAARLVAGGDIDVAVSGVAAHAGVLHAGLDTNLTVQGILRVATTGRIGASGQLHLTGSTIQNSGLIYGLGALEGLAANDLTNTGRIESGGNLTLTAGAVLTNIGDLEAVGLLGLSAPQVVLETASSGVGAGLDLTGTDISLRGLLASSQQSNISASGELSLTGQIYSEGSIGLTADRVVTGADSLVLAGVDLTEEAAALDPAVTLHLIAESADLAGQMQAGGPLSVDVAGVLGVTGAVESTSGALAITAGVLQTQAEARLVSDKDLTVAVGSLTHAGVLFAGQEARLDVRGDAAVTQTGAAGAANALILEAANLNTAGLVYGVGRAEVSAATDLLNSGRLESGGALDLVAGAGIESSGHIEALGRLSVSAPDVTLAQGSLTLADTLTVSGTDITLRGQVGAAGLSEVVATGTLTQAGQFYGQGSVRLAADQLITSADSLTLAGADLTDPDADLLASGDLALTARVAEVSGQTQAGGAATVRADETLTVLGTLESFTADLTVSAGSLVTGAASRLVTGADLSLTVSEAYDHAGLLYSDGDVSASVDDVLTLVGTGQIGAAGRLGLEAGALDNNGLLSSIEQVTLTTAGTLANKSRIESAGGVELTAGARLESFGTLDAGGQLSVTGQTVAFAAGSESLSASLAVSGDNVDLAGTAIVAGDSVITALGNLTHTGRLYGEGAVSLSAAQLRSAAGSVLLAGVDLSDENAVLNLNAALHLSAGTADLAGLAQAGGDVMAIVTRGLSLTGTVESASGLLSVSAADVDTGAAARLVSGGDLELIAGTLDHAGLLFAEDATDLTVTGSLDVSGTGQIGAATRLTLTSETFTNDGLVFAMQGADLSVDQGLVNRGRIESGGDLSVAADRFENLGRVYATGKLTLTSDDLVFGATSSVEAGRLSLGGDDLTLAGSFATTEFLDVSVTGALTQNARIYSEGGISLSADRLVSTADSIAVAGVNLSDGDVPLYPNATLRLKANSAQLAGQAQAGGDAVANVDGTFVLTGALESTNSTVRVQAADLLTDTTARLISGSDLEVEADQWVHQGVVYASGKATVRVDLALNNAGQIGAHDLLTVTAGLLDNTGLMFATDTATLTTTSGSLANAARIEGSDVTLTAETRLENAGTVSATDALSLNGSEIALLADSSTLAARLTANGETLTLAGLIGVAETAVLDATGTLTQAGQLYSQGAATLTAGQLVTTQDSITLAGVDVTDPNAAPSTAGQLTLNMGQADLSGLLQAGGSVVTDVTGTLDIRGVLQSTADTLTVTANRITAHAGSQIGAAGAANLTSHADAILNGQLFSGGDLAVSAAATLRNTGIIDSADQLRLTGLDVEQVGEALAPEITVNAGNAYTQSGNTYARDSLTVTAGADLAVDGQLGTVRQDGDSYILSGTTNLLGGTIRVNGEALAETLKLSSAQSIENYGSIASLAHTVLDAETSVTNSGEIDTSGQLDIFARDLTNVAGQVISAGNLDAQVTGTLTNRGEVGAVGLLQVVGHTLVNSGDLKGAGLTLEIDRATLETGGTVQAENAVLTMGELLNMGRITAQDGLLLDVDNLTNEAQIFAETQVVVEGETFTNTASGNLGSATLVNVASTIRFENQGTVDSTGGLRVEVTAGDLVNAGSIHGQETALIASGQIHAGMGSVQGQDLVALSAAGLNALNTSGLSRLERFGIARSSGDLELRLTTGGLNIGASQSLEASGALVVDVADGIENHGLIRAGEALTLRAGADVHNLEGRISAFGDVTLVAGGMVLNRSGLIESGGDLSISATMARNEFTEVIQSNPVRSDVIDSGTISRTDYPFEGGSEGCGFCEGPHFYDGPYSQIVVGAIPEDLARTTVASGYQLSFSGSDGSQTVIHSQSGALTWTETATGSTVGATPLFVAQGDLAVSVNTLENLGGTLSARGNVMLAANTVRNSAVGSVINEYTLSKELIEGNFVYGDIELTRSLATGTQNPARIFAGGTVQITDQAGQIPPNSVLDFENTGVISANSINIIGHTITTGISDPGVGAATVESSSVDLKDYIALAQAGTPQSSGGINPATGAALTIGEVLGIGSNTSVLSGALAALGNQLPTGDGPRLAQGVTAQIGQLAGQSIDVAELARLILQGNGGPQSGPTTQQIASLTLALGQLVGDQVDLSDPAVRNLSIGTLTEAAGANLLRNVVAAASGGNGRRVEPTIGVSGVISTPNGSAAVGAVQGTDPFSRSDLFASIGANPTQTFLADPAGEAEAIRLAALARTGRGFLSDEWETIEEQQAELRENARRFAQTHPGAEIGKALTDQQIDDLKTPLLWYVTKRINGQDVLVPTLYLSDQERNNSPPGSLIARERLDLVGDEVTVSAAALTARDITIRGNKTVQIQGRTHIDSTDGLFRALDLENSLLIGNGTRTDTFYAPTLNASGDLNILAGTGLSLIGARIEAGENIALGTLTGPLIAGTGTDRSLTQESGGRWSRTQFDLTEHVTTLRAGGNVAMTAGTDIALRGTEVQSGGTIGLTALHGSVTLDAARRFSSSASTSTRGGFFSKRTTSKSRTEEIHIGTRLSAGADLTITAASLHDGAATPGGIAGTVGKGTTGKPLSPAVVTGIADRARPIGDILTAGSTLQSRGGSVTLNAAAGLRAGVYEDKVTTTSSSKRSFLGGLLSKSTSLRIGEITQQSTRALSAEDLTLVSAGGTELIGTQITRGGALTLNVGGDLDVKGAINRVETAFFESDMGLVLMTTEEERTYDETVTLTSFGDGEVSADINGATRLNLYFDQTDGTEKGTRRTDIRARNLTGITLPEITTPRPDGVELAVLAQEHFPEALLAQEGVDLLARELAHEYFHEETRALSPAFKALLAIVITQGIGMIGGAGLGATITGGSGALATGINAFASSFAVNSIDAIVAGDVDIGDILKDAAFAGVTAGLGQGINLDDLGLSPGGGGSLLGVQGGQFTLATLAEHGLDNLISAGASSLVYDTDFGDSFLRAMGSSVASLASADLQSQIGDLFADGQNGGEGSLGHVIAHAAVGCGTSVLSGASCGAGALGGAAQSLYAGTDPATSLTPEQVERNARLIGAVAGYLASEGKGENVSIAASVAASGAWNNYLKHSDITAALALVEQCLADGGGKSACEGQAISFLKNTSEANDIVLAAMCNGDADCVSSFIADVTNGSITNNELRQRLNNSDFAQQIIASGATQISGIVTDALELTPDQIAYINGHPDQMIGLLEALNQYTVEEVAEIMALTGGGAGVVVGAIMACFDSGSSTSASCQGLASEVLAMSDERARAMSRALRTMLPESADQIDNGLDARDQAQDVNSGSNGVANSRPAHLTSHPDAHTVERHGPQVTDQQLEQRALTGVAPDGSTLAGNRIPPLSSAFNSEGAMLRADSVMRGQPLQDAIAANPTATSHTITFDVGENVGRGYRRIGSSNPNNVGRNGPPERVEGLTHAQARVELNQATGEWETITMFPTLP